MAKELYTARLSAIADMCNDYVYFPLDKGELNILIELIINNN